MSDRPPGDLARGYAVGFALLRLDVRAIERLDGSVEEARRSVRAMLLSLPLIGLTMLLYGASDITTLSRLPVLIVELSSTLITWLAIPVLVSIMAPSIDRAERVPLFVTVYNYYYAVSVLVWLLGGILIGASGEGALLWLELLNIYWFWTFLVSAFAFRAVLRTGWGPAIALTLADYLITMAVGGWSDALVVTICQS